MKFEEEHAKRVALLEELAAHGMLCQEFISEVNRDRMTIMKFLRKEHGDIKVSPRSFATLPASIRREIRDFMNAFLGNDPRAKQRINEALGKGKRSRHRDDRDEYS